MKVLSTYIYSVWNTAVSPTAAAVVVVGCAVIVVVGSVAAAICPYRKS